MRPAAASSNWAAWCSRRTPPAQPGDAREWALAWGVPADVLASIA
jgi:hypothetical protein